MPAIKKPKHGCISGYFNPIHEGHIALIRGAKAKCDFLSVILNNEYQRELKGSVPFYSIETRIAILSSLRDVDQVILSIDQDDTVCQTLELLKPDYFFNAGDRIDLFSLREVDVCRNIGCHYRALKLPKVNSSSSLISNAAKYLLPTN